MFNTDKLQKVATAAVGALILSTACVTAAVGPAAAAERAAPAFSGQYIA
jgi:hypothetical protein